MAKIGQKHIEFDPDQYIVFRVDSERWVNMISIDKIDEVFDEWPAEDYELQFYKLDGTPLKLKENSPKKALSDYFLLDK